MFGALWESKKCQQNGKFNWFIGQLVVCRVQNRPPTSDSSLLLGLEVVKIWLRKFDLHKYRCGESNDME